MCRGLFPAVHCKKQMIMVNLVILNSYQTTTSLALFYEFLSYLYIYIQTFFINVVWLFIDQGEYTHYLSLTNRFINMINLLKYK